MTAILPRKSRSLRKKKKRRKKVKHQRKKVQVMKILTRKSPPKIREAKLQRVARRRKKKDRSHLGWNFLKHLESRSLAHRLTYMKIILVPPLQCLLLKQRKSKAKAKQSQIKILILQIYWILGMSHTSNLLQMETGQTGLLLVMIQHLWYLLKMGISKNRNS